MAKQLARTSRVEAEVAAPIEAVWRVVADVTRTGEWSHECYRVTWVDGATSAVPGARFRGGNKALWWRWSRTSEVVELEAGRVIGLAHDPDLALRRQHRVADHPRAPVHRAPASCRRTRSSAAQPGGSG